MIKKLAWNTFKNTGNINTFLELMEVENVERDLKNALNNQINYEKDIYGNNKDKGNNSLESNMGDFDKMVSILTPDIGKIGCAAKGARKPKSPLMAGTQFLSFSDLVVYSGVNSYNLNSCEPIEVFYNIRKDLDKSNICFFYFKACI